MGEGLRLKPVLGGADAGAWTHAPLGEDDARYFQSLYILVARAAPTAPWPLWVASVGPGGTAEYRAVSVADGMVTTTSVSPPGPDAAAEHPGALPSLEQQVAQWRSREGTAAAQREVHGAYDVLGVPLLAGSAPAMTAEFTWRDPASMLAPPPASADGLLRLRAVPGSEKSAAHPAHANLQRAQALLSHAAAEAPAEAWPADAASESVHPGAAAFVASIVEAGPAADGTDLDFTERLWDYVKDANGLADMLRALGPVLRAMRAGEVQPVVHRDNNTAIAAVARQCLVAGGADALAALMRGVGSQIEAIAELGVARARRALQKYLVSQELCTPRQLAPLLDGARPLPVQLENACRLRNVVEVACLAQSFADLPHAQLRELVAAALEFYGAAEATQVPVFTIALPAFSEPSSKVRQLCTSITPASWQLVLSATERPGSRLLTRLAIKRPELGLACEGAAPHPAEHGDDGFFQCRADARVVAISG